MTDHNQPAGDILNEAKRLVCNERTAVHGDTQLSFHAIAQIWQAYLRATHEAHPSPLVNVTSEDVAQMMSLLKKVRHIFGDSTNPENFVDDAGFTSIAGMFAGVKVPQKEPEPSGEGRGVSGPQAVPDIMRTRLSALNAVKDAIDDVIR